MLPVLLKKNYVKQCTLKTISFYTVETYQQL